MIDSYQSTSWVIHQIVWLNEISCICLCIIMSKIYLCIRDDNGFVYSHYILGDKKAPCNASDIFEQKGKKVLLTVKRLVKDGVRKN